MDHEKYGLITDEDIIKCSEREKVLLQETENLQSSALGAAAGGGAAAGSASGAAAAKM